MNERNELMRRIQMTSFAALDLQLFLDTHPDNQEALNEFNRLAKRLKELRDEYEVRFGPMLNFGNSFSKSPWQWIELPWPWQKEMNM